MSKLGVLIAVASYSNFPYLVKTVRSALAHTPDARVLIVDDASPEFDDQPDMADEQLFLEALELTDLSDRISTHFFKNNDGLTRSWNHAASLVGSFENIVFANNDLIFTPGWWQPIRGALRSGKKMVGPVTNAPGRTDEVLLRQHIKSYTEENWDSDSPSDLQAVASDIGHRYKSPFLPAPVNGFCFACPANLIKEIQFSAEWFFPPNLVTMPSGRANPSPRMTGQEDWLQHRVRQEYGASTVGVCIASYVYHYRSVARGTKYATSDARRMQE